jgi:tetratricopeptide (TPR) repeat protein
MIKIFIFIQLIIILFLSTAGSIYSQTTEDFDLIFDKGIEYERQNKLKKAEEMYRKALEIDETNNTVKVRLAKVLSWQGNYEDAMIILDKVLEDERHHSEALFRKAQILSWQGKYNESLATYQIYLIKEKNDADALMGIARVCFWTGQNDKAIEYFNLAINAGADEIDARLNLGKVYLVMGNIKKAKEEFNRVLELDPGNAEAVRFLLDIRDMNNYEISPLNVSFFIYPDGNVGITASAMGKYNHKQKWDFSLLLKDTIIARVHDFTVAVSTRYRGIDNLYLLGSLSLTPASRFSPTFSAELGADYALRNLFVGGLSVKTELFPDDTLFILSPVVKKYFSDITYIALMYSHYFYTSEFNTGKIKLHLDLDYYNKNPLYIYVVYGGDVENKIKGKGLIDLGAGITYNFTENYELTLGYAWIDSTHGNTHEIGYRFSIKW